MLDFGEMLKLLAHNGILDGFYASTQALVFGYTPDRDVLLQKKRRAVGTIKKVTKSIELTWNVCWLLNRHYLHI